MKTIISESTKRYKMCDGIIEELNRKGFKAKKGQDYNYEISVKLGFLNSLIFWYDTDRKKWRIKMKEKHSKKEMEIIKAFEKIAGEEVVRII